jgi:hypothetical protein
MMNLSDEKIKLKNQKERLGRDHQMSSPIARQPHPYTLFERGISPGWLHSDQTFP